MQKSKRMIAAALLALMAVVVAGCGGSGTTSATTAPEAKKVSVVVTTPVLADFVSTIGSDLVDVYDIVKPNVDPHDYEPTPADLNAIAKADVIVRNGVGLDAWLDRTIKSAGSKAAVVDASTGVTLRTEGNEPDPHIWHRPANAKVMVSNIRQALAAADPENAQGYQLTERAYDAQIDALDATNRQLLGSLANKKLVTNHDAFGYYVDEYKLTYVGSVIPSFDTQAELSSAQITDLVNKIKAEGVKAVFSESSLPPKTAETISSEAGVKIVEGADSLYGDSMGVKGSDGDTYLKMEAHNTNVIVANLR